MRGRGRERGYTRGREKVEEREEREDKREGERERERQGALCTHIESFMGTVAALFVFSCVYMCVVFQVQCIYSREIF